MLIVSREAMGRHEKIKRSSSKRSRSEVSESSEKIMIDNFGVELWELCPLDKAHYFKRKDMTQHLISCKRQFLKSPRKVECPFNPLHIINRMEIEEHIMTCVNRVTIVGSGCDFEPKREQIEGVLMEPINTMPTFDTYWENEEPTVGSYDAMDNTKFRTVLRPVPPGLSKKQKKEFKAKERQRWKWLAGETKEKPRVSPYPTPDQIRAGKVAIKTEATIKEEANVMNSIIDGLSGAKIGDPRNSIVKQINARLKVLQLMRIKLKEEEIALQRQVEEYLASVAKTDDDTNGDPRLAGNLMANLSINLSANVDPRTANADHTSRILPDIMTSAMIR